MKKDVKNNIICFSALLAIFLLALYCNAHTSLLTDDYAYMFDFSEGWTTENPNGIFPPPNGLVRIKNVAQIVRSMAVHRLCMNGRVIAHGLVQLMLMFPKTVFNVANSLALAAELVLIVRSSQRHSDERNGHSAILALCFAFSVLWLFQPSFGQVNYWLDGSINYLWGTVLILIYIYTFIIMFHTRKTVFSSATKNAGFLILCFLVGAYNETGTIAMIVFTVLILLHFRHAEKISLSWSIVLGSALLLAGAVFLVTAPAELKNKVSGEPFTAAVVQTIQRVPVLFSVSQRLLLLFALTGLLFLLALYERADKKTIKLAAIIYFSAIASYLCLAMGKYIPRRTMFLATVLVTLSACITMVELARLRKTRLICYAVTAVLSASALYSISQGVKDITKTYRITSSNEAAIVQSRENGIRDIEIPDLTDCASSEYCAANGLLYLSGDETMWPNVYMAKYYDVDTIHRKQ